MKVVEIATVVGDFGSVPKSLEATGGNGDQKKNWYKPDYGYAKIRYNVYKISSDLRRLAVSQISVKTSVSTGVKQLEISKIIQQRYR